MLSFAAITLSGFEVRHDAYFYPRERWNGWLLPYFKKEEAMKMNEWLRAEGEELRYDEEGDRFLLIGPDGIEEEYPCVVFEGLCLHHDGDDSHVVFEKARLYPIGAGSWTWYWPRLG